MHKNRKCGFSLAEAMITILIIGIIALLTVPIAKKMVKKQDQLHGKWICTINKAGQHVMWQKGFPGDSANPESWNTTGDSCTFNAPLKARNFSIQAIGGGGGGAAGVKDLYERQEDFAVEYYGVYRMVAVGAGGAGGMSECDVRRDLGGASRFFARAGGGGAGGAGYATVNIDDKTYKIEMRAGAGKNNTSENSSGEKGDDSYIRRYYSGGYKDIIYANGGAGGGRLHNSWHDWEYRYCEWWSEHGDGIGGSAGSVSFNDNSDAYKEKGTYNSKRGTDLCRSFVSKYTSSYYRGDNMCYGYISNLDNINNYLDPSGKRKYINRASYGDYDSDYGRGGNVGSSKNNKCSDEHYHCVASTFQGDSGRITQSKEGFVIAVTDLIMAGGAGKTGKATNGKEFYPSFPSKQLVVTIGKGGAGGVADSASGTTVDENTNINGEDGGDTIIGNNWIVLKGGEGGTSQSAVAGKSSPGGNGEKTPIVMRNAPNAALGGLSDSYGNLNTSLSVDGQTALGFGTGGGGGGILVSDDEITAGNGGNGAPGYVIIEW